MTMLRLHDTLTGEKRAFVPRERSDQISLYVCGPTVYNYAHIGNARPVVVFDVLYRLLKRLYPDLRPDRGHDRARPRLCERGGGAVRRGGL
jgi:cysteinyl-tRNA synthetase